MWVLKVQDQWGLFSSINKQAHLYRDMVTGEKNEMGEKKYFSKKVVCFPKNV